jgi:hypothetical protein
MALESASVSIKRATLLDPHTSVPVPVLSECLVFAAIRIFDFPGAGFGAFYLKTDRPVPVPVLSECLVFAAIRILIFQVLASGPFI